MITMATSQAVALNDVTQSHVGSATHDDESSTTKKPIRRSRSFKKWFKNMKSPRKLKPSVDDSVNQKENFSPRRGGSVRRSMSLGNSKDTSWKRSNAAGADTIVHGTETSGAESVADTYINLVSASNNEMFEQQRHNVSQIEISDPYSSASAASSAVPHQGGASSEATTPKQPMVLFGLDLSQPEKVEQFRGFFLGIAMENSELKDKVGTLLENKSELAFVNDKLSAEKKELLEEREKLLEENITLRRLHQQMDMDIKRASQQLELRAKDIEDLQLKNHRLERRVEDLLEELNEPEAV
eukprot:m.1003601 g.1003601  ORF g.1003601 m.1003601 type:complete len:298 (+) comp24045_c0_seq2:211-1104(+)